MTRPLTLAAWLMELRRKGTRCRLSGGRLRVSGLRKLEPPERDALLAAAPQVKELLQLRAERRQRKQQSKATAQPEQQRKVVGMRVVPGYPQLSRLLFEDETRPIPQQRGRVLMVIPYGWRR